MNEVADEQALKIPAPFVNKFQVLVAGSNIRIAFAEGIPNQPNHYRSAVVVSSSDALEIVDALLKAIQTISPPSPTGALFGLGAPNALMPNKGILGGLAGFGASGKTDV